MARLFRPYIPLSVRVQVAERQVQEACAAGAIGSVCWSLYRSIEANQSMRLKMLLQLLFENEPFQLDHDPALIMRKFNRGRYYPDANDPEFLAYRSTAAHLEKTTGRRPGAARTITTKGSDAGLAKKFRKLEGKTKSRPKQKIPSRPFQNGKRKIANGKARRNTMG